MGVARLLAGESQAKRRWVIPALFAVALLIRLGAVLGRPHLAATGDALFYHDVANLLVGGRGWVNPLQLSTGHLGRPTAAFPPLFPLVLALASAVGAKSFLAHRIWCAILGSCAVFLAAGAGRSIAGRRAGWVAAAIVAVYPNLWMSNDLGMSETLSPLLALGVLWAAYACWRDPRPRRAALVGVLLGLAILGRDEMALLAPLLAVPLALGRRRTWRRRAALLGAAAATAILVVGPWVGYNMSRFKDPVFVSDGLGVTLASANCDRTWYGPYAGYWALSCAAAVPYQPGVDESVQGSEAQHYALHYVSDHLGGLPRIEAIRLGRAFGAYRPLQQIDLDTFIEGRPHGWALVGLGMYYALIPCAVAGAVITRRRGLPIYPAVAVVVDVAASVLLTFGQTRYRSILEPVLAVFAAVAIDRWWRAWRGPRQPAGADTLTAPQDVAAGPLVGSAPGAGRYAGVLVVVPALNEETSVSTVVYETLAALPGADVLVVDDGSVDGTAVLARAAGARVASTPFTIGVGGAVQVGFRFAQSHGYRAVMQIDGDGQHDPADAAELLAHIEGGTGPRIAVGNRFGRQDSMPVPPVRRLAMRALAGYVSRRTGVRLDDVTSGYRAHNRAVIELFARHYPAEYLSDTVESLVIGHGAGATIVQVPVHMRPRTGGSPSQGTIRSVVYLGRVALILLLASLRRSPRPHVTEDLWTAST